MNTPTLLIALLPELAVLLSVFAALGIDYGLLRNAPVDRRNRTASLVAGAGLLAGLALVVVQIFWFSPVSLGENQIVLNSLTLGAKAMIFGLAYIVVLLSERQSNGTHVSEYYALLLLSALGAGFLACTDNLLLLFVALELMSLSLYALAAFDKSSPASAEAALKYLVFGAVSSAFLLFGLGYFYGATHTLNLQEAFVTIARFTQPSPLLGIGVLLILVGLGFKMAMAPFHFWAPDVYQHAPTPIAGWIASGSKIAAFLVLVKILRPLSASPESAGLWTGALAFGAAISLVIGNFGALRQKNLKRLLAYSSIGHAGYMLTGVLGGMIIGVPAVLFYVALYAAANLGAFGVIHLISGRSGSDIQSVAGCWKRKPGLALLLGVYFLSLAGIPPLAGFVGKFYLFFAAIGGHPHITHWYQGYYWLVGLGLLFSAISLYYYLRVLKACFVSDPAENTAPIEVQTPEWIALALLGFLILAGGLFPEPAIEFLRFSWGG